VFIDNAMFWRDLQTTLDLHVVMERRRIVPDKLRQQDPCLHHLVMYIAFLDYLNIIVFHEERLQLY